MKKKKSGIKKTVLKHIKKDVLESKKSIQEDKSLEKKLKKDPKPKPETKAGKREKFKVVMDEYKAGELHSGSKNGPIVTNPKQAIAISLSESGQSRKKSKRKK
jgi:uncharacterized protein DUF6496